MKVDFDKKRLSAVKLKFEFFPTKCQSCREEYVREKMWKVARWGINKTVHDWHYCRRCMPTAEAVLYEIDTDGVDFGVAYVDSYSSFEKRDRTRLEKAFPELPEP